jgi:hypothetical protein
MLGMGPSGRLAVDVTVVHPLAVSQHHSPTTAVSCLQAAELAKERTHESLCSAAGWEFAPFGVSSFGHVGKGAMGVLRRLSAIRDPQPDESGRTPPPPPDGSLEVDAIVEAHPALRPMVEQVAVAALRGVARQLLQHFSI